MTGKNIDPTALNAALAASQPAPTAYRAVPTFTSGRASDTAPVGQPAQPVAVKVKPLVWDKFDDECYSWKAPLFGSVLVKRHWKGAWVVVWSTPGYTEIFVHGHFPTPHEAKAAAEARIMAALDVQPLTVQDAARVLLEAVKGGLDPLDAFDPTIAALAVKHAGNRGDGVIQLEIAEEFFTAALRAIAEGK